MFDFYKQIRAEGCINPVDRDMLLFQWGTYDWGQGLNFQLDVTRQFIMQGDDPNDPDDDVMSQLQLTFYYQPTPVLAELSKGTHWCKPGGVPDKYIPCVSLEEFISFVYSSPAYLAVASVRPKKAEVKHGLV